MQLDIMNGRLEPGSTSLEGKTFWLGTDDQSRDVLARLIYGFRISVLFGLTLTILSSIIGIAAGGVQGYFGGWIDLGFQRFIEVWTAIPSLYLLLIISAVLPPGFFILLGILLLFSWVSLVGLVRDGDAIVAFDQATEARSRVAVDRPVVARDRVLRRTR